MTNNIPLSKTVADSCCVWLFIMNLYSQFAYIIDVYKLDILIIMSYIVLQMS
jgi:hypothetical protein